jgi:chemotaxis protein CheD
MSAQSPPWRAYRAEHVPPGAYAISSESGVVISTLLGSCIAACLLDPERRIGGLNHFLLPEGEGTLLYGDHAMEVLLNAILARGGRRHGIVAKIFGGAQMVCGSSIVAVGERNIGFVRAYLSKEGFPLLAEDVGGSRARRIWLHPSTGRVWVEAVQNRDAQPLAASERRYQADLSRQPPAGEIDIFT